MDRGQMSALPEERPVLRGLALVGAFACVFLANIAPCGAAELCAGDRIRFTRSTMESVEATLLSATHDTLVVSYDGVMFPPTTAYGDSVWLGSLTSLEVRLKPVNMLVGFVGGVALGGMLGGVVAEAALASHRGEEIIIPAWVIGAPVGALLGGVFGVAFAHDRGMRWTRIPLSHR
jgi:hypothetical protein